MSVSPEERKRYFQETTIALRLEGFRIEPSIGGRLGVWLVDHPIGVILLIVSGTLVGVMFSVVAYKGNSIANSAIIHTVWNFAMITGILRITTEQGYYGNPIFSIIIPADNVLLTGAGFGVEASIIAIIGYACICAVCLMSKKRDCTFLHFIKTITR